MFVAVLFGASRVSVCIFLSLLVAVVIIGLFHRTMRLGECSRQPELFPAVCDADFCDASSTSCTVDFLVERGPSRNPLQITGISVGVTKTRENGTVKKVILMNIGSSGTDEKEIPVEDFRVNAAGQIVFKSTFELAADKKTIQEVHRSPAPTYFGRLQGPLASTLLYLRRGYLKFDDRIEDGFFDGGRETAITGLPQYLDLNDEIFSSREIIVVDSTEDDQLSAWVVEARDLISLAQDVTAQAALLAVFVSNVMGGVFSGADNKSQRFKKLFPDDQRRGKKMFIGQFCIGKCRHRAILFKYLADRLNIPSMLVRGIKRGKHVWNVIRVQDALYVLDVMQRPHRLLRVENEMSYVAIDGEGNRRGAAGPFANEQESD
jgi:hypothetical protein